MKRFAELLAVACAFAAAVSCTKDLSVNEEIQDESRLVPFTIEASMPDTKATLNGREVFWQEGDKIAFYDNKHAKSEFTLISGAGTKTAVFQGTVAEGFTGFYVVYPYSAAGEKGAYTIPEQQNIAAGANVDPAALIMTCGDKSAVKSYKLKNITFTNAGSVARMTVPAGTTSVTFSGEGCFYTANLAAAPTSASQVDLVVPAGQYKDILVAVTTSDGSFVKASDNTLNLPASTLVNLGDVKGDPATLIKTGEELKSFLGSWPKSNAYVVKELDLTGIELPDTASVTGVFDGRGCAIKNADLKAPIFNTNNGTIKNVVIDASSKSTSGQIFAPLALTNNGSVISCVNNSAVTFNSATEVSGGTALSGLVVYNFGTVKNCTNNADVTYTVAGPTSAFGIAGIASYTKGEISKCVNNGKIKVSADYCKDKIIIGAMTYKVVGSCGGVACYGAAGMTATDCTNNGEISYDITKINLAQKYNGAGLNRNQVGGIIAAPSGDIKGCVNTGIINVNVLCEEGTTNATEYLTGIGGISGGDYFASNSQNATNITSCQNLGNINAVLDHSATNNTLGGIVAWPGVESASQTVFTRSCVNRGDITISGKGKGRFGGIQGGAGNIESCTNYGTITNNTSVSGSTVGGVCGYRSANMTMKDCANYGKIINNHADFVYTGALIGAWSNSDFNAGTGCIVSCDMECSGAEGGDLHKYTGMVIGNFNGDKTDVLGSEASPIKVSGSVTLAGEKTVLDASNYKQWCHGTYRTSNLTTESASKRTLYVTFEAPTLVYGGVTYKIVMMADKKWWMAENLRYIPEGKTVSDNLSALDNGIWYPVKINAAGSAGEFDKSEEGIAAKGYLYNAYTAFGVARGAITADNAASFEGCQGICPDGWHLPTVQEEINLVGKCNNSALTWTGAPYYDSKISSGSIAKLEVDNWPVKSAVAGMINISTLTATSGTIGGVAGTPKIVNTGYFIGSSLYKVTTSNIQFYSMMPNVNNSNISAGYMNMTVGASIRCVMND